MGSVVGVVGSGSSVVAVGSGVGDVLLGLGDGGLGDGDGELVLTEGLADGLFVLVFFGRTVVDTDSSGDGSKVGSSDSTGPGSCTGCSLTVLSLRGGCLSSLKA